MIDIVITADYEVFGNGTGDVRFCLIAPTSQILSTCKDFGAKLTLFFEIVEYWAFKRAEAEGKLKHLAYSPSALMQAQAEKAIKEQHDVQLHLHPQWLDSEYTRDGWRLNLDYWRLPKAPHGLGSRDDILSLRGLLFKGKSDLEKMLRPVGNGYECVALRAGGYCIQPARNVIQVMKEVGLLADSSVFKGGYIQQGPFDVDFRNAHDECAPWWADPDDINKALANQNDTILEVPICTMLKRRVGRLTLSKILQQVRWRDARRPPGCEGYPAASLKRRSTSRTPAKLIKYLFEPVTVQLDYCALTADEMWSFVNRSLKKGHDSNAYVPVVMIGHPKTFVNQAHLGRFLARITRSSWFRDGKLGFATMTEAVQRFMEAQV
jgi:hypothetical protein